LNILKQKLKDSILLPASESRREVSTIAKVTSVNERNNTCSINYINKQGYKSNKFNVYVKIYNKNILDWFPKINDYVNIIERSDTVIIDSPCEVGYDTSIRPMNSLRQDIHPSSSIIGGIIL